VHFLVNEHSNPSTQSRQQSSKTKSASQQSRLSGVGLQRRVMAYAFIGIAIREGGQQMSSCVLYHLEKSDTKATSDAPNSHLNWNHLRREG